MNDRLRNAMNAADLVEMDALAEEIGATAVRTALAVRPQAPDPAREEEAREKAKQEAADQRQRDSDAALADAIETVARHRTRLGRKTFSAHDGAAVRKVFDVLRNLAPGVDE